MKKTVIKATALLLLLSTIFGSLFFIIYPNYSTVKIQLKQFNTNQIANNTILNIFSTISLPAITEISHEQGQEGTLEFLSTEQLEQHKKTYGIAEVERYNTEIEIISAEIKGRVVDGEDANAMERGFWFYPLSAAPGKQGNTVIIGHRFLHIPPRRDTFFNLDKVKVGDKIKIKQEENTYTYTVINTREVEKNNSSILANTSDYRITLITCTPLWTSEKRLVITGKMDKVYGNI